MHKVTRRINEIPSLCSWAGIMTLASNGAAVVGVPTDAVMVPLEVVSVSAARLYYAHRV